MRTVDNDAFYGMFFQGVILLGTFTLAYVLTTLAMGFSQ